MWAFGDPQGGFLSCLLFLHPWLKLRFTGKLYKESTVPLGACPEPSQWAVARESAKAGHNRPGSMTPSPPLPRGAAKGAGMSSPTRYQSQRNYRNLP